MQCLLHLHYQQQMQQLQELQQQLLLEQQMQQLQQQELHQQLRQQLQQQLQQQEQLQQLQQPQEPKSKPALYREPICPTRVDLDNLIMNQMGPIDLSKNHKCQDCPQAFRAKDRLRAHQRRNEIKRSGRYTCDKCGKQFVQQSSLITHRRIHTGEKPYHCIICNNSYGDLSTYTKHLRTHTGEKPYKCEYCEQRFSQSGNCLRHKRSVHSDSLRYRSTADAA